VHAEHDRLPKVDALCFQHCCAHPALPVGAGCLPVCTGQSTGVVEHGSIQLGPGLGLGLGLLPWQSAPVSNSSAEMNIPIAALRMFSPLSVLQGENQPCEQDSVGHVANGVVLEPSIKTHYRLLPNQARTAPRANPHAATRISSHMANPFCLDGVLLCR